MDGLNALGAEPILTEPTTGSLVGRTAFSLLAGATAAALFNQRPVLAFIGGAAVAGNLFAFSQSERTGRQVVKNLGRHAVAIAGSLALPKYPAWGYIAGAVAGNLLLSDDEDGLFDAIIDVKKRRRAEQSTALVKQ